MSIRLSTRHLALISSFVAATSALGSAPWSSDPAPESLVSPPDQDEADSVVRVDYVLAGGRGAYTIFRLDDSQKGVGFKFENPGGNRILPVRKRGPGLGPTREYEFAFKQRARQDIHLEVTDSPTDYFSDSMESYFYFFPRKVLPAIQWPTESGSQTFTVVLPTEERVEFDLETREIVSGVLSETAPLDLGPVRSARKFAGIRYEGTGIYLRVDRRAGDPRFGTTATVFQGSKTCRVPSAQLFDQSPESSATFLFPTDIGFSEFLRKKCGFSFLP